MSMPEGFISLEEAAPLMLGVLDGLAYAHLAKVNMEVSGGTKKNFSGIVHRDIKPQNILLADQDKRWIPKVADFGLSKSFESAGLTDMTQPGQVAGTPVYWPREQITHYRYLSPATDVFSIAAVFYEMLTGCKIRSGFQEMLTHCKKLGRVPGISDYFKVIMANPVVPLAMRNPRLPEPVTRVIDQALHEAEVPHNEEEMRTMFAGLRYPDAGVFRDKLAHALNMAGVCL
jgi:serine/threonine protein kinase